MCHLSRPPNYRGWGAIRGRHLQLHQSFSSVLRLSYSWDELGQKIKLSHLMMPIFQSQTDWNEHTKANTRQRGSFGFIEVILTRSLLYGQGGCGRVVAVRRGAARPTAAAANIASHTKKHWRRLRRCSFVLPRFLSLYSTSSSANINSVMEFF